MAAKDSTKGAQDTAAHFHPFNFESAYTIAPNASVGDLESLLETRLAQLEALLQMTCGEPGEALRNCQDLTQDAFMWACRDKARECRELFNQVHARGRVAA